jgi:predicted metal-dependent enzyme (double-stranded beta helix superfamily)
MFEIDELISACTAALGESHPGPAIREVLERAMSKPANVAAAFDPPAKAELVPLYASPELTILHLVWAPRMQIPPHDHRMWAAIGIYGGAEDNRFFRRSPDGLVPTGERSLSTSNTVLLGADTIHAVTNPSTTRFTGAIHVYGGDFLNKPRSVWDAETLEEGPATGEDMRRLFETANAARDAEA